MNQVMDMVGLKDDEIAVEHYLCHPDTTFEDIAFMAHQDGYVIVEIHKFGCNAIVTYCVMQDS